MATPVRVAAKQVKPILSFSQNDARNRVLSLYKSWYRQLPFIVTQYDMPKSLEECRQLLKEEFRKHKDVEDIRVIDILVIKGTMDLQEATENWKTNGSIMNYFKETWKPKKEDFLSKFLAGEN